MRPNVPVPSRRKVIPFLKMMHQETGSMLKAILAFGFDGPWTSSGGSFRLARKWVRHRPLCEKHSPQKRESHLPGNWCRLGGFRAEECAGHQATISGLSGEFREQLGESVFLHFTNLTPWHASLPKGVTEHPYVTAAGLGALENRGVQAGEVDIIYSQAAAYFEQDYTAFLRSAARLLKEDGVLIFNHDPVLASAMDEVAWEHGLRLVRRKQMGGMNGAIARYHRLRSSPVSQMVFPGVKRAEDEEVVCESLVMSALRRNVEV
jgi:hypothetical protein